MSDCSCIYAGDCDGPGVSSTEWRTARKEHSCSECGRTIKKGEKYEFFSGNWDGEWDHYKTCEDCYSAREAFFCDSYPLSDLWMWISEHFRSTAGAVDLNCLGKLTKAARNKVCEIIEREWQRQEERDARASA